MATLITWEDCINNTWTFEKYSYSCRDGVFIDYYNSNNEPMCFMWLSDGVEHRLDGPAVIYQRTSHWYYKGEKAMVFGQENFRKWLENREKNELDDWIEETLSEDNH